MHIAQNWRLNNQRYAMKATKCATCGQVSFPQREVCPHCREAELKARESNISVFPEYAEVPELRRAGR